MVPIAVIAWYRLHRYAWYRYSAIVKLVHEYPHIKLLIIGDGPDKSILIELINSLDENVKNRICLRSPVTPAELSEIMRDCNLNVSVAGCATMGARCGVLTLPARHYNYDCEVYGFIPDSLGKRKYI